MSWLKRIITWYFSRNVLPYWCVLIADILICYLSGLLVFWLYYRGVVTFEYIGLLTKTIAIYMVFNLVGFRIFKTYTGILRYSSFVDLQRIGLAMALSCAIAEIFHYIIFGFNLHFVRLQGRQILLMYILATILMWGMRILIKTVYDVLFSTDTAKRTLIYGVREGAMGLAKFIRSQKPMVFHLKGFISNCKGCPRRILMGVKTYEVNADLANVIARQKIQAVLVSPLQVEAFRNDSKLHDLLIDAGVQIYMVQEAERWTPESDLSQVRLKEINIEDLLPRQEIKVDMDAIGRMLTGKSVMITGNAGTIGSEMLRQIGGYKPAHLILVDQAETPQHDIRLMMRNMFPDIPAETIVVSITQADRMEQIFAKYRPDYLFHAAAYKHVPMMEDNPSEAIINNVWGTKIIADLSVKYGVKKFVMISTDKAVNPTGVMGCSKRICEIYTQSLNRMLEVTKPGSTQFVTTRFGNVLGSNGSVIPIFEKQIKKGGPVTVTHPDIVRYFMLISEACRLVLEAGTHGKGGEIFVFDMGQPVRIADLAKKMVALSGAKGVKVKYVGLRDGEKLYEEPISNMEDTLPSFHEKIRIAKVLEYEYAKVEQDIEDLNRIAHTFDDLAIVNRMREMVPEYTPNNTAYGGTLPE